MARVVVGMSGGVDSSLSASLLAEAGHEVIGVTMKLWPCAEQDGGFTREDSCCSPTETIDARSVAQSAGIRHYVIDMEDAFRAHVVNDFMDGYARGITPSPCVRCNESIKFGSLWDWSRQLGAERVATGHYARVGKIFDRWALRRSVDTAKDQTYFLFSLTQEQLACAEFPVGAMDKSAVREASRTRKLVTADKHESMDICFVGAEGPAGFLARERPDAFHPGPIALADGRIIGEHRGLHTVTIGQRRGLGVAWHEPLVVLRIDAASNTVTVGAREALLQSEQSIEQCTWHLGALPAAGLPCLVRPRHRAKPVPATVHDSGDGRARVVWQTPQPRVSPGQAVVVYDLSDDWCLGGGWAVC